MGILSALSSGIRRGADDAASASDDTADDAARTGDDNIAGGFVSNDEVARDFNDEVADGVNSGGGYNPDTARGYAWKRWQDELSEGMRPDNIAAQGGSTAKSIAKIGGATTVGGVAIWQGGKTLQDHFASQVAKSKEAAFEEYNTAREQVMNNENLSPEEKEDRLNQLQEAYQQAVENPENGEDGGLLSSIGLAGLFDNMGIVEKGIVAIVVVVIIKQAGGALR